MPRTYQPTTLEAAITEIRSCLGKADAIIDQLEVAAHRQDTAELQRQLEKLKQLYQQALVSLAKHTAVGMEPKKIVDLPHFVKGGCK